MGVLSFQDKMEIYYSSLPATLKTVMAKNKEKMDNNVSSHCINHIQHNKCYRLPLGHTNIPAVHVTRGGWLNVVNSGLRPR